MRTNREHDVEFRLEHRRLNRILEVFVGVSNRRLDRIVYNDGTPEDAKEFVDTIVQAISALYKQPLFRDNGSVDCWPYCEVNEACVPCGDEKPKDYPDERLR